MSYTDTLDNRARASLPVLASSLYVATESLLFIPPRPLLPLEGHILLTPSLSSSSPASSRLLGLPGISFMGSAEQEAGGCLPVTHRGLHLWMIKGVYGK